MKYYWILFKYPDNDIAYEWVTNESHPFKLLSKSNILLNWKEITKDEYELFVKHRGWQEESNKVGIVSSIPQDNSKQSEILKNLFYSGKEKVAFYIVGYASSAFVSKQVNMLKRYQHEFALLLPSGIRSDEMKCREILKSSRFKYMIVFWMGGILERPKNAYDLEASWTMEEWIQY